jgi:predicted ATPase/DNA-binding XRE family transcriptional regulator
MTSDQPAGGPDVAVFLRQRRRSAGLTQAELALRAGLAVRTVREVESGRTARPRRTTAVLLADALGLAGSERARFLRAARGEAPVLPPVPTPRASAGPRHKPLPPAPALVGREAEVARLAEVLTDPAEPAGPLALVGVAGVGKSALAVAVAHEVADRFPGGVAGIMVTGHSSAVSEVVDAVGSVFGVPRHDQLASRLAGEPALLLVDAVDRAPPQVRAALARLPPAVRVITTGRAPLGLPGERIWPVLPLDQPPATAGTDLAEVAGYPAAALFLNRLARVRSEPLAADEVPALAGLVRRLGGLPLALELAAAHGRLLRLPEILERYGDRVLDLGAEPDRTLREAVAASYRLLTPTEQHALRWLAAFRNRWSIDLAEQLLAVGGGPTAGDPVPLLDRMVSLGLVAVQGARENRFRLLGVVRDFATEQAERLGELARSRRAHAVVIARLAGRLTTARPGGRPVTLATLDDLAGDVWAALNHAANDAPRTALCLASRLPGWWRTRGRDVVGRQWLRRLLDDPRTADADRTVRARAMLGLAQLALEDGDGASERPSAEAALAEFRRLGDVGGELAAGAVLNAVCVADGRYEQAREHCVAALELATRSGRPGEAAVAQLDLAWHDVRVGNLPGARRRLAAVDRLAGQAGQPRLRLLAAVRLAEVARLEGRYEEAVSTGGRVLARLGDRGDPGHRRPVLGTVGLALAALRRVGEAERVLTRLRADDRARSVAGGAATSEGVCAAIEARLALARGDRVVAAEWFASAATAFRSTHDQRGLVAALVDLAACTTDPQLRRRGLAEIDRLSRDGGVALLAREQAARDRMIGGDPGAAT